MFCSDQFGDQDLDNIVTSVDRDHDGKISFEEFMTAVQSSNGEHLEKTGRVIDKVIEEGEDESYTHAAHDAYNKWIIIFHNIDFTL